MSQPFLGEIKIVSFNFPPKGWAMANGQLLPINQNQALFSLFGTSFGGNGQVNFAIPNLQGRTVANFGQSYTLGTVLGEQAHTLTAQEMPQHTHLLSARKDDIAATAVNSVPTNKTFGQGNLAKQGGQTVPLSLYGPLAATVATAANAVVNVGGSQAHNNMMPYLVLNFIVALVGIFPSQN